jgi:hypothetical protein
MSRIRHLEITNFRGVRSLDWFPGDGINCLVGRGDSGKSTILDAIELCLGARRNVVLSDADFYQLNTDESIRIAVTIGELEDRLKSLDDFGLYLRGFDLAKREVCDEPLAGAELALTVQLTVGSDLEPLWSLYSDRAAAESHTRTLNWSDRLQLAPMRLGASGEFNLSWRRGSLLNRLSEQRADASAVVAQAAREARAAFGGTAGKQVTETLGIVKLTASELGIPVGEPTAMLDAGSFSLAGGTISLHDGDGVPLRELGLGSARLLIAGLQRRVTASASVVLVDELEYGLEPHRIIRLLTSLGAKEATPPIQAFVTTHSPVALCELAADQLHVLRKSPARHEVRAVGGHSEMQATIRACAEAFLADSVIVCEGASEIGLLRGLDLHRTSNLVPSMTAVGVALADGRGDTTYRRANAFVALGYRTLIVRDADKPPDSAEADAFARSGGAVIKWTDGRALEQELFESVSDEAVLLLIEQAVADIGTELVNEHIKSASNNVFDLVKARASVTPALRAALGKAAKSRGSGWFKTIADMESLARRIVGPDLPRARPEFVGIVESIFSWVTHAPETS